MGVSGAHPSSRVRLKRAAGARRGRRRQWPSTTPCNTTSRRCSWTGCWCPGRRSAPSTACTTTTPRPARRKRAPAPGPPGSTRQPKDRGLLGGRPPGRHPGRRRPPRRPDPARGKAAQPAHPRLAPGHLIQALADKAAQARITVTMVDERGTSSTCPACRRRIPNLPGGSSPARTASSTATATWSRRPASPPARAAGSRRPCRVASRTAGPGRTCQVCPRRDVTAPPPSSRPRPRVPWPAPARPDRPLPGRPGSRSPHGEDPVRTTHGVTQTCTKTGHPPVSPITGAGY